MLKIEKLRLPPGVPEEQLLPLAARALHVPEAAVRSLHPVRRSLDARGEEAVWEYTVHAVVEDEGRVLKKCRSRWVTKAVKEKYHPPKGAKSPALRPVVVGAGPAGLFCALILAQAGVPPILLERGAPVEERQRDVEAFWRSGKLNPASNVQFGEGGAGAFSDGKLNTGTRDLRHRYILGKLVEFGAPASILIDAKPHAGTDMLHIALQNMRRALLELGTDIRFHHQMTDVTIEGGRVKEITVRGPEGLSALPVEHLVLALGHSARDTVEMLYHRGVPMEAKPFAVGVRIEHLQRDMDAARYGRCAGRPGLPASSYTISRHVDDGRTVFGFCVCPGGTVVASASEEGRLVTNGMSLYARDGENINGGLLVNVTPADFGSPHPLAGIAFQRRLEEAAYRLGGGGFIAPAQRVGDFLAGRPSEGPGKVKPTYRPGVRFTDLRQCLPEFVARAIAQALPEIDAGPIPGYGQSDAVLTAVESRSSAPVRILRDRERYCSAIEGLYPCGEGAGYAGGIMSAASDGIHVAEQILEELR